MIPFSAGAQRTAAAVWSLSHWSLSHRNTARLWACALLVSWPALMRAQAPAPSGHVTHSVLGEATAGARPVVTERAIPASLFHAYWVRRMPGSVGAARLNFVGPGPFHAVLRDARGGWPLASRPVISATAAGAWSIDLSAALKSPDTELLVYLFTNRVDADRFRAACQPWDRGDAALAALLERRTIPELDGALQGPPPSTLGLATTAAVTVQTGGPGQPPSWEP